MCHESWLFQINTLIGLGLFSIIKKSVHNNLHTICKFWENVFCKLKESCGCFKSQVRMRLNFIPDVLWSIGSEAIQIFYFSNWQISLTLKRGFYTYCLSPQAYCLNAIFCIYPTKSILRPTSGHRISTFYSSLESLEQEEADCTIFAK